jgi:hypothetical protein
MSNILKGILNETSPHDYDSDWDYQDAVARSGKSRSSYRSSDDDTFDADVAYSRKMYQLGQQQKAAKEKSQRDSDHDRLASGTNEGDDNIQTRMRLNDYYDLADAIQEKLRHAIRMGDKERIQQLSKERDELDARITKHGLMPESQLDEISNEKLSQYKTAAAADAGKADKEGDYKRGDKRFSGIVKATKKQFANDTKKSGISQGISEDRFNSKQDVINYFVKNGKSAAAGAAAWERGWRGSSNKPIELKKPPQRSYHDELDDKRYSSNTFENLGDQLKSTSLDALVKAKLAIEQQREADIEAWRQDFEKNTVQKAQQGLNRELEPTPVAQPGEKHSVLKARLAQLNNAIQKQELLDKLVDRLDRRGILTPAMQNDADTRMHVKYGSKDNYQSLNKKLDNAIQILQNRLNIRKISGLKEVHDERDEYDNPRQGRDYGKGNLFVDPGSTEFPKEKHRSDPDVEVGRPKHVKGVSKGLPADAFGRITGKIPAGKRGTVHSKMGNTDEVDEDISRRGFLKGLGAAAVAGAAGNAMGQAQRPMAGLPNVDKVDKQKMTITLDGQEYPLVILSPTDLRPRGGQQVHITCAELGQRCLGRYDAILAFNRVFVLPEIKPIERPKEVDEEKQRLDPKCWDGYKKQGTKMKGDTRVNNCVPVKESSILQGIKKV